MLASFLGQQEDAPVLDAADRAAALEDYRACGFGESEGG